MKLELWKQILIVLLWWLMTVFNVTMLYGKKCMKKDRPFWKYINNLIVNISSVYEIW